MELGAKKFHEQRTTGPLLFESAPAPPSAGFNVTFEDWTLDTAAGAPPIFARLAAVKSSIFLAILMTSTFNHLSQKIAGRKTVASSRNTIALEDTSLAEVRHIF